MDLTYGGALKATLSCVSLCSSVWATRQAFRLRGKHMHLRRKQMLHNQQQFRRKSNGGKGQTACLTSENFVPLLILPEAPESFMCLEPSHQRLQAILKEGDSRRHSYGSIDTTILSRCRRRDVIVRGWWGRDLLRSDQTCTWELNAAWQRVKIKAFGVWEQQRPLRVRISSTTSWSWKCYLLTHSIILSSGK